MKRLLCGLVLAATIAPMAPAQASTERRVLRCERPVAIEEITALGPDVVPAGCAESDEPLDPLLCSTLRTGAWIIVITGSGVIVIGPDGDLYIFPFPGKIWDCPPYDG